MSLIVEFLEHPLFIRANALICHFFKKHFVIEGNGKRSEIDKPRTIP